MTEDRLLLYITQDCYKFQTSSIYCCTQLTSFITFIYEPHHCLQSDMESHPFSSKNVTALFGYAGSNAYAYLEPPPPYVKCIIIQPCTLLDKTLALQQSSVSQADLVPFLSKQLCFNRLSFASHSMKNITLYHRMKLSPIWYLPLCQLSE